MNLIDLGYNTNFENYRKEQNLLSFEVGRVIAEHKERYVVKTDKNEFDAEIIGNLKFTSTNRSDFPVVGDWVAISEYDEDKALIHAIFDRENYIGRKAVGKSGEEQIIASNIDFALVIQAVDRDFSVNRLERYLSLTYSANVKPIIILNKIDLIDEIKLTELTANINNRIENVPIIAISNETKNGYTELQSFLEKGKTFCLLGSSGVGKSTLTNNLLDKSQMKTDVISASTNRGKHITSHRELIVLESGAILIDNPGMREVGIADTSSGVENVFDDISQLSSQCKYADCTHTNEKGCAVLQAVEDGEINEYSYENYLKMMKEKEHFQASVADKRKKDKDFSKMVKGYVKTKKKNRF